MSKKKIFIYGAGGHAKVVIDALRKGNKYEIAFLIDDAPDNKGISVLGCEVLGGRNELLESQLKVSKCIVAIGDNVNREDTVNWLIKKGFVLISVVHPAAVIGGNVKIGGGSVVMAGCILNADVTIGDNAIINTGAIIEHDCTIHDNAHVAPGAVICGGVTVYKNAMIGAAASINPGLSVGKGATIGSGASVVTNICDHQIAKGVPAKVQN